MTAVEVVAAGVQRYSIVKRAADIVGAAVGLMVLSPLLAVIAVVIKLDDPGPAVFRQTRAGAMHRPFTILKFRTMRVGTPSLSTEELSRHKINPVTRVGIVLRRTSLDELPQLWNVLVGDMSIVGPRPALLTQEIILKGREDAGVHVLRPGVTGLAQVSGRDDLPDTEKLVLDAKYLASFGLLTDLRVVVQTLSAVLSGAGNH